MHTWGPRAGYIIFNGGLCRFDAPRKLSFLLRILHRINNCCSAALLRRATILMGRRVGIVSQLCSLTNKIEIQRNDLYHVL